MLTGTPPRPELHAFIHALEHDYFECNYALAAPRLNLRKRRRAPGQFLILCDLVVVRNARNDRASFVLRECEILAGNLERTRSQRPIS